MRETFYPSLLFSIIKTEKMFQKNYDIKQIPKKEVWRYLGRTDQEIDEKLDALLDAVIKETLGLIRPMVVGIEDGLSIQDKTTVFQGISMESKGLARHLKHSQKAVLLAATLGRPVERAIEIYELTDLTRALLMDACASVAVEVLCDMLSRDLARHYNKEDLKTTRRFSPGYSDLPLSLQPELLRILEADKRIGVTTSDTCLLRPRKSVTAFIGIGPEEEELYDRCSECLLRGVCNHQICSK